MPDTKSRAAPTAATRKPRQSLLPDEQARIRQMVADGFNIQIIADTLGRDWSTVQRYASRIGLLQDRATSVRAEDLRPPSSTTSVLSPSALKGLSDFGFFCRHYFGHVSTPWRVEAANVLLEAYRSPEREFVVLNCPSGVGKSTLKHDLAAWITCHDRAVRGLFGGDIQANADRDLRRLRSTFERTSPIRARPALLALGLEVDSVSSLTLEYGRFKPLVPKVWREQEFLVEQPESESTVEKEATWSSFGRDTGVLGNRYGVIFWDDLVTKKNIKTIESTKLLRDDWDGEFESRLEPGGLMVLIGQRMAPDDLYRHCLDKMTEDFGEDDEGNEIVIRERPTFRHIVFKAHYEDRCLQGAKGSHRKDAKPYPEGCLLEPMRLPWVDLNRIRKGQEHKYRLMYQQEDYDPSGMLVDPVWITGGKTEEGIFPGCIDPPSRRLRTLPEGIRGPLYSIACIDPSAENFWGATWWIYAQPSELRFLFDLFNERMSADKLLDWSADTEKFGGLMESWQNDSRELGYPITHWIIEQNAAQRWLFQFDHFRRWVRHHGVSVVPHTTGAQKLDPDYGVQMLGPLYKWGRVRLPDSPAIRPLTTEVTRWSVERKTRDDLVMSQWFLEAHLPAIIRPSTPRRATHAWRPSWMLKGRKFAEPPPPQEESEYETALRRLRAGASGIEIN